MYRYDHIKQVLATTAEDTAETTTTGTDDAVLQEKRLALERALDAYMRAKYPTSGGAAAVFAQKKSTAKLVMVLCAERVSLRNYWSGRWKSRWEFDGTSGLLSGSISIHVHYFENGNLQLQTQKDVKGQRMGDWTDDTAQAIVSAIRAAEDDVQSNLEDMYLNMSHETFKEMRRVTPITQTKMDWNISQHRAIRTLATNE